MGRGGDFLPLNVLECRPAETRRKRRVSAGRSSSAKGLSLLLDGESKEMSLPVLRFLFLLSKHSKWLFSIHFKSSIHIVV